MRIVAVGGCRGRNVKVTWSDEAPLEGPRDVLQIFNSVAVDNVGTEVSYPEEETIAYDHLRKHYGFVFIANQIMGSRAFPLVFRFPDGRPPYKYESTWDLYEKTRREEQGLDEEDDDDTEDYFPL